ncbi:MULTISPECIES: preprotein translocase subunit YajC [Halopseudomonas]|jgi:preprotein translocase subunit YajC|uniref:Sec translocon accessory complex subunit YajC n=1 Tax=Halopseudomonas formosensis TaxID=1002526 RepID=A0ABU5BTM9_9GAMM|nr:preprotein translocase subunit YajC [Halopseudomonas formosensis]MDX9686108.1 preprotein translocase subunit YajC [Halopseudomonas formosensis]MDY3199194.1 preprotein translocase subunit YajC [Pseudomonadaceae bacterium]MDY3199202.1 preprotein translocase subunit YajC [Pseudomonadaceae bacterium]NLC01847.1 preprotein translocase subunit YajC [Halopseudomonas formosensis]
MSFFISSAMAQTAEGAGAPPAGFDAMSLIFLVGFVVIFYLMIWRPQAKRAKEHKNLLNSLSTGDEVVTNGGILGKVKKVTDEFIVLEVSEGQELKFQKGAVVAALPKGTLKAI